MDGTYLFTVPTKGVEETDSVENAMKMLTAQAIPPGLQPREGIKKPSESETISWVGGLRYRIRAEIEVSLDTTWDILPNFTLTEISLRTRVALTNSYPAIIGVEINALFEYNKDTTLQVTGTIPRITEDEDIDFILTIKACNTLDTLPVYDLLERLAGSGSSHDCLQLHKKLEDSTSGSSGAGFAVAAQLIITRKAGKDAKEGEYFLKGIEFALLSRVTLTLIPEQLVLTGVSFAFKVHKEKPEDKFSTDINLGGTFQAGEAATFAIKGRVQIKETVEINLNIAAGPRTGIRADTLFALITSQEGSSAALESAKFPPTAKYPQQDSCSYQAELGIQKTDTGWSIDRFLVAVEIRDLYWKPVDALELALKHISFHLYAARPKDKNQIGLVNDRPETSLIKRADDGEEEPNGKIIGDFRYVGSLQGVLYLWNIPLSVAVTYDSMSKCVTIVGDIADDVLVSMQEILQDPVISTWSQDTEENSNDVIKVSKEKALPDACPVDLSLVDETEFGYRRRCTLVLAETKAIRVRLVAEYAHEDVDWLLWSGLKATQMGLLVDIDRSATDDKNTIIQLAAFGRFKFNNGLELFGAINAAKSPSSKYFWLRLSASLGHDASIGKDPYKALSSSEFAGLDLATEDWILPSSAPSEAQPVTLIHSFHARLDVMVAQSTSTAGDKQVVSTGFSGAKLEVMVAGPWKIFEGFEISFFSLIFGSVSIDGKDVKEEDRAKKTGLRLDVSTDMTVANLPMRLAASFSKVSGETTTFLLSLQPIPNRPSPSPAEVAALPMFGSVEVDERSKGTVPDGFPVKANTLLTSGGISAELLVTKENGLNGEAGWKLSRLTFTLDNSNTWEIIGEKLKVTHSSLSLQIDKPKTSEKTTRFMASATIEIGGIPVKGTLQMQQYGDKARRMLIFLEAKNVAAHVKTLTDISLTKVLSQSSLTENTSDNLNLSLYLEQQDGYKLREVQLQFNPNKGWELGPFTITGVVLIIQITEKGTKVCLKGECRVSYKVATVSVFFEEGKGLVIKFRGSDISCTDLAKQAGGQVEKVDVPNEVGLQDYESKKLESGLEATATFVKGGGGTWEAKTLSFSIASTKNKWTLVPSSLWLSQMKLQITIENIQKKDWKVTASIVATFSYTQRPPDMTIGNKDLSLIITRDFFRAELETRGCTLPQFVYIVTAGYLDLPDFVPKIFTPGSLVVTANWKKKVSRFEAIFDDWTLPSFMKNVASMRQPRLDLSVTGWGGGGSAAEGWLRGTAVVFGVKVPLAYKLPNGPFTVFGIDVKRIYDLVVKLYRFFRSVGQAVAAAAEAAAAIAADLAAFAIAAFEMAAAALSAFMAAVGAALAACGVAAAIVKKALKALKWLWDLLTDRGNDGPDDDDESQSSSDRDSSKKNESISVSGAGVSPGAPNEVVELRIYPRKKGGSVWADFEAEKVELSTSAGGLAFNILPVSWKPTKNYGYEASYTRPAEKYVLFLHYANIDLRWIIPVEKGYVSNLSPAESILRCPNSCLIQQPIIAEVYPRDQLGQPRYGLDKPESFTVSLMDDRNAPIPTKLIMRNDCLLIKFVLDQPGDYTISVTSGGAPIVASPLGITALLGIDPRYSFARGEGVSSGLQNTVTSFEICFRDARDKEYKPTPEEQARVVVQLSSASAEAPSQPLAVQWEPEKTTVSYTRPGVSPEPYVLDVWYEGAPIQGSPYILMSRNTAVSLDLKRSLLDVEQRSLPLRVGKPVRAILRLRDNYDYDWRSSAGDCTPSWVSGPKGENVAEVSIQDNGNGTYTINWTFSTAGKAEFFFKFGSNTTQSIILDICDAPVASNVLINSTSPTQTDLRIIDQYGDDYAWDPSKFKAVGYSSKKTIIALERVAYGLKYADMPRVLGLDFVDALGKTTPAMVSPYILTGKPGSPKTSFLHQGPLFPRDISPSSLSSAPQEADLITSYLLVAMDEDSRRVYRGRQDIKLAWVEEGESETSDGVIAGLIDRLDGTYEIQVVCPTSKSAALQIKMDGEPICGSPYKILPSGNAWSSVRCTGEGWDNAILEEKSTFEIAFLTDKTELCQQGVYNASVIIFSSDYSFIMGASVTLRPGKATVEYTLQADVKPGTYFCRVLVNTLPISMKPHQIQVEEAPNSADVAVSGLPEIPAQASSLVILQAEVEPNWTGTFEMLVSNVVSKRPLAPQIFTFKPEPVDDVGTKSASVEFGAVEMNGKKFKASFRATEEGCVAFSILCFKKTVFTTHFWASDVTRSTVRQDPFQLTGRWPLVPLQNYGFTSKVLSNKKGILYKKSAGVVAMLNQPAWLPGIQQTFPSGFMVVATISLEEGGTYEGFQLLPFIRPSCSVFPTLTWSKAHGFEWRQSFGHHHVQGRQLRISSLNTPGPHTMTIFWSVDPVNKLERLIIFDDGLLVSNFQGTMGQDQNERFWPEQSLLIRDDNPLDQFQLTMESVFTVPTLFRDQQPTLPTGQISLSKTNIKSIQNYFDIWPASTTSPRAISGEDFDTSSRYMMLGGEHYSKIAGLSSKKVLGTDVAIMVYNLDIVSVTDPARNAFIKFGNMVCLMRESGGTWSWNSIIPGAAEPSNKNKTSCVAATDNSKVAIVLVHGPGQITVLEAGQFVGTFPCAPRGSAIIKAENVSVRFCHFKSLPGL